MVVTEGENVFCRLMYRWDRSCHVFNVAWLRMKQRPLTYQMGSYRDLWFEELVILAPQVVQQRIIG
jgi:hypothetical protein